MQALTLSSCNIVVGSSIDLKFSDEVLKRTGCLVCSSSQNRNLLQLKNKTLSKKSSGKSSHLVVKAILDVPTGPSSAGDKRERDAIQRLALAGFATGEVGTQAFISAEERIYEVAVKEAAAAQKASLEDILSSKGFVTTPELLNEAYERCGEVCAEYAKTFYLGTKLMTPERQRAIWAIYVWCRRTDELVDGPNAPRITPKALDRWEERLEDIFNGQPYDMLDAALADTVRNFPVNIQPFRDMVEGMRMDLRKARYANFDELYVYCYNVAGTVGLMSVPVMGIAPESAVDPVEVYNSALGLGIANQLTNILRDVGEDARRGRIYLPQNELHQFGLSDADVFEGVVTDKWRAFMKFQINRAREYFARAESGVAELDRQSRWPVWASLSLYRQILDSIEANDYDNFTKRAYVKKWKKILSLPGSYVRAQLIGPSKTPIPSSTVPVSERA